MSPLSIPGVGQGYLRGGKQYGTNGLLYIWYIYIFCIVYSIGLITGPRHVFVPHPRMCKRLLAQPSLIAQLFLVAETT